MKRVVPLAAALLLAQTSLVPMAEASSPQLQQGIAQYQKGYVQKAIPLLRRAAQAEPNNAKAQLWLARALKKQGGEQNFEAAKDAYRRTLAINPSELEALTSLGELLSWSPDTRSEAIELLTKAHEINPADAMIAKRLSETLAWEGLFEASRRVADPIAEQTAKDIQWMNTYAFTLARTGEAGRAVEIYENTLKAPDSKDVRLRQSYAYALAQNGQTDQAKELYGTIKDSVTSLPEDQQTAAKMELAALAYSLGEYQDALSLDQSLPENIKSQTGFQLRIARSMSRTGRVPEAIDIFQRLYASGAMNMAQKIEYADYLKSLNLPSESLPQPDLIGTIYTEAMASSPQQADLPLRMARQKAQDEAGYEEAVSFYKQALKLDQGDNSPAKREFFDFLKSDHGHLQATDGHFKSLLSDYPEDVTVKGAYAEFLSYQESRRPESLKLYLELVKSDNTRQQEWKEGLEQVLSWHKPQTNLEPLYQEILELYPDSKPAWISLARAYRNDPRHYGEALKIYQTLRSQYPDDEVITREWTGALAQNESRRDEALKTLKAALEKDPKDKEAKIAYGQLLSYERRYDEAMRIFEDLLKEEPKNRDALVGKGYTLVWSGRPLEGKKFLTEARKLYPEDVEVALALATAEKTIGRYDRAIKLLKEIKPKLNQSLGLPEDFGSGDFRPCDYETDRRQAPITYDYSILPYSEEPSQTQVMVEDTASSADIPAVDTSATTARLTEVSTEATIDDPDLRKLQGELQSLNKSLTKLQTQSSEELRQMGETLGDTRENIPSVVSVQTGNDQDDLSILPSAQFLTKSLAQQGSTTEDARNESLSGQAGVGGPLNEIHKLEWEINRAMRPELRSGYGLFTQKGDRTTTRMHYWGFQNQLSLSLTPQLRIRGGISPRRFYLPDSSIKPNSTWGTTYSWGATYKPFDRLTLDGDMDITHFSQSDSNNVTWQANAKYDFTDRLHLKVGGRRYPLENSLLSYTGFRPTRGRFEGDLVGQSRENSVYVELNTNPFTNVDWNLGYEFAVVNGSRIPDNYKNQFFTSVGYTANLTPHHALRMGYEFLFFSYSKNATNGYFDLAGNLNRPLVKLDPATYAARQYVYGGYFSPSQFFLNALRLDLRGDFYNKKVEYKIGGSLGIQSFDQGHGISESSPTSLASSFDGNVMINWTDWLATFGNVEFLDAGGAFQRWRFGGGLVIRPDLPGISPVVGGLK